MISWTWLIEKQMEVIALRALFFVTPLLVELVQVIQLTSFDYLSLQVCTLILRLLLLFYVNDYVNEYYSLLLGCVMCSFYHKELMLYILLPTVQFGPCCCYSFRYGFLSVGDTE